MRERLLTLEINIRRLFDRKARRLVREGAARERARAGRAHAKHHGAKVRAINHLKDHWKDVLCPYCGHHDWDVGEPVQLLASGIRLVPMHLVGCSKCGHTTFVRADKISPG